MMQKKSSVNRPKILQGPIQQERIELKAKLGLHSKLRPHEMTTLFYEKWKEFWVKTSDSMCS
jgi:hypothetical protein